MFDKEDTTMKDDSNTIKDDSSNMKDCDILVSETEYEDQHNKYQPITEDAKPIKNFFGATAKIDLENTHAILDDIRNTSKYFNRDDIWPMYCHLGDLTQDLRKTAELLGTRLEDEKKIDILNRLLYILPHLEKVCDNAVSYSKWIVQQAEAFHVVFEGKDKLSKADTIFFSSLLDLFKNLIKTRSRIVSLGHESAIKFANFFPDLVDSISADIQNPTNISAIVNAIFIGFSAVSEPFKRAIQDFQDRDIKRQNAEAKFF